MTIKGSNASRDQRSFSSPEHPDQLWALPSLPFSGYQGKAAEKNGWSYTSTPLIGLDGANRDKFTITL